MTAMRLSSEDEGVFYPLSFYHLPHFLHNFAEEITASGTKKHQHKHRATTQTIANTHERAKRSDQILTAACNKHKGTRKGST